MSHDYEIDLLHYISVYLILLPVDNITDRDYLQYMFQNDVSEQFLDAIWSQRRFGDSEFSINETSNQN